jgi:hypothetical protein
MGKVSARGVELEAAAAARLDQFRGLPAKGGLPDVNDGPLLHDPTNADQAKIAAVAERAVADGLHIESDADRKPKLGRPMVLVKSDPAAGMNDLRSQLARPPRSRQCAPALLERDTGGAAVDRA